MRRKCDIWALAVAALALSSTASASEAEEREASESSSITESESVADFTELWVRAASKAWSDRTFKQELLADPARALETHFNYEVPRGARLAIVEGRPGQAVTTTLTVTIPVRPTHGPAAVPALFAPSSLWSRVITKAWRDRTFKRALLADPEKALLEYFNYGVPPDMHLRIVEGRPGQRAASELRVTLPPRPGGARRHPRDLIGFFC